MIIAEQLSAAIKQNVNTALKEDIGQGDISAKLINKQDANAIIISREPGILCGSPWVDEVFRQLSPKISINWKIKEGQKINGNDTLATLKGPTAKLLTGERTALNFLQTLSATATTTHHYLKELQGSHTKLLDTRKTLPGLRIAQKYAAAIAGAKNHRLGLYDAFLIKENHIKACGGITKAIKRAQALGLNKIIEIEVEDLNEFSVALEAGADIIMLDNFSHDEIKKAMELKANFKASSKPVKIEVSGGITYEDLKQLKTLGVDYISLGAITKHIKAIDLSFQLAQF